MAENKLYIVSGANGFIGNKVVALLSRQGENIVGLCREPDSVDVRTNSNVSYTSNREFLKNLEKFVVQDYVFIHLAFGRSDRGFQMIADSLDFTKKILKKLISHGLKGRFVYISSQGVYGRQKDIRCVSDPPQPDTSYSMAKYAAEKMVEMAFSGEQDYCILRLDNVIQSQNLVKALSESAIIQEKIHITGGKQVFSYIDVDDAAAAIVKCACYKGKYKRHIYNVGPNEMCVTLIEIADMIKQIADRKGNNIEIVLDSDDTALWAGMNSWDFYEEFDWSPQYNIMDMVERVYENVQGGGYF